MLTREPPPPRRRRQPPQVCLVVPCYNEAGRLQDVFWHALVRCGRVHLIFVDDGSCDATLLRLTRLARALPGACARLLALPRHVGRGEAVRRGLLLALEHGYPRVGYIDADGAVPAAELLRLIREVLPDAPPAVMGARIPRRGARIRRTPGRRLLGRLFADAAALALGCAIYDAQCPAKFFCPSEALQAALARPFCASWTFDTELLARLLYPDAAAEGLGLQDFLEVPLREWHDVAGSKLTWRAGARAAFDLMHLARKLRRGRARNRLKFIESKRWRTVRSSVFAGPPSAAPPAGAPGQD